MYTPIYTYDILKHILKEENITLSSTCTCRDSHTRPYETLTCNLRQTLPWKTFLQDRIIRVNESLLESAEVQNELIMWFKQRVFHWSCDNQGTDTSLEAWISHMTSLEGDTEEQVSRGNMADSQVSRWDGWVQLSCENMAGPRPGLSVAVKTNTQRVI